MDEKVDANGDMLNSSEIIKSAMEPYRSIGRVLDSMKVVNEIINPSVNVELPKLDLRNYNLADFKYEKIKEEIESFQKNLTDDLDVMVQMATFGKEIIMAVEDIGYQNPDLLYFYGTINGQKSQLIQHQSQLNFLLLACKKDDPKKKPHRIGFNTNDNE